QNQSTLVRPSLCLSVSVHCNGIIQKPKRKRTRKSSSLNFSELIRSSPPAPKSPIGGTESSASSSDIKPPPPSSGKQVHHETLSESGLNSPSGKRADQSSQRTEVSFIKSQFPTDEHQSFGSNPRLRRSRSFSSAAAFFNYGLDHSNVPSSSDRSSSPSSSSSSLQKLKFNHSSWCRESTPEGCNKAMQSEAIKFGNDHGVERHFSVDASNAYPESNSSNSSSNISNKVLDLYIDGEEQEEKNRRKSRTAQKDHGGRRPPRIHCTRPASPKGCIKDKPRSQSFRGPKEMHFYCPPNECIETGDIHDSRKKLAKHVVEKLSQSLASSNSSMKDFDRDVCGGSLNELSSLVSNGADVNTYPSSRDVPEFHIKDYSSFNGEDDTDHKLTVAEDEDYFSLNSKLKEAEERVLLLSEKLDQENFLHDIEFNVPALVQQIRSLTEEKIRLITEVSSVLQDHIAERTSLQANMRSVRVVLDAQIERLEKEKVEMQAFFEKELDRRSDDWSFKLEKYQSEEKKLRQRVRELAEQNVMLQREVSSLKEKEAERMFNETQMQDLKEMMNMTQIENQGLQHHVSELQQKYECTKDDVVCIKRNFGDKVVECKELYKSITRLLRTRSEQEKTIDGLRGLQEAISGKQQLDNSDKLVQQLQVEQIRLTGIELALRREVEACKREVDSLRKENINLFNRLQECGKEGGSSTFKLDRELSNIIHCLQTQGLPLLNESTNLCSKLLDFIKARGSQNAETADWVEVKKAGLAGQFMVESDMKIQAVRRGAESVTRSLQVMSSVLHEKRDLIVSESHPHSKEHIEPGHDNIQRFQDLTESELKAERLLTRVLREKLYMKDLEVEQLEATAATAVRGNDTLRSKIENALDTVSCLTHNIKDLELQMNEKDEKMNLLNNHLQESTSQLTSTKGILQKVTKESDLMWREVKQYSEKNMLLNTELNVLKKKIEALEEDILLKEGQIAILKDSLGKKPLDLLEVSSDHVDEFLVD
ncbi:hypothetical protein Drorol1_Dr00020208, partial [Drosera rotundifolia]